MFWVRSHATASRMFLAWSAGVAYLITPLPGLRRAAPFEGQPISVTMMFLFGYACFSMAIRLLR